MAKESSKLRHDVGIAVAGAFGSLVAIFADLRQKEHASAMLKLSNAALTTLHIPLPTPLTMVFVIAVGVVLCFLLEARSTRHAFFTGLGVLSTVMVLVPYELPPSLSTRTSLRGVFEYTQSSIQFFAPAIALAQPSTPVAKASEPVEVKLTLRAPDKNAILNVTITLRDLNGKILARSVFTGTEFAFVQPPGEYVINLEVPGYSITECVATLHTGKAKWIDIALQPSAIPLAAQRLFQTGGRPADCQDHKP